MASMPDCVVTVLTDEPQDTWRFEPSCVIAQATLEPLGSLTLDMLGLGAHQDRDMAITLAKSELTERYAIASIAPKLLLCGPCDESLNIIDPRCIQEIPVESALRFSLQPFDPRKNHYWVEARNVLTGETVQLLAELCYAFTPPEPYPQRFAWCTSCGVAAHPVEAAAEQAALLELFERDALMVTWMNQYSPPHIPFHKLPPALQGCKAAMAAMGYQCFFLDITCRTVPVVMAVIVSEQWPALIVTLAARFSLAEAMCAAWKEMEVELFYRVRQQRFEQNRRHIQAAEVVGVEDHALYYSDPANTQAASFLWSSDCETSRVVEENVLGNSVFDLSSSSRMLGLDSVFKVTYNTRGTLHIVRILSPNLVPLLFGYRQFPISHPARKTVINSRCATSLGVPVFPHPFS